MRPNSSRDSLKPGRGSTIRAEAKFMVPDEPNADRGDQKQRNSGRHHPPRRCALGNPAIVVVALAPMIPRQQVAKGSGAIVDGCKGLYAN